MTQSSENGSRLDRIEAIMFKLATASVRHDNEFSRINASIECLTAGQELNREAISNLTTSIMELRNLVAN
jgi:hypothetical protein